jgi:hypothetical protein
MQRKHVAVSIEWMDSATTPGWQYPDNDGPAKIISVGLLVRQDKHSLTISTSVGQFGRYCEQLTIPRSVVKKLKKVRL